ncbi:MAG: hypothetical protein IJ024_07920 [Lachnospiraceae bacterium]|nr:hypothetical protein [Lachnospiraceae bacterium]
MDVTTVFVKLLNMSFTGAVAIMIVYLVRLLFKKLPKKYICILWAVILVRLLCPFTLPTFVAGQPDIPEPIPSNIMEVENPYIHSEIEVVDNVVNTVLEQNFTPNEDIFKQSANPLQIAMAEGALVWCAGIAVMLIYTAWNLLRFRKWVREAIPENMLSERVYRCTVETPVVAGIFNPRIYLPFGLEEPQLGHVLTHERMHIKRKDHLLKLLFYVAVIIHWFNPFVWLAYRLLERDMEMACDEAVLEKLGTDERTHYCESLLDLASSKNHFVGNPVAFGESDVKLRIKNLINYKKPYFWVSVIAVIVIITVAVTCLSSPSESGSEKTSAAKMVSVEYPLTKEAVEAALSQVDLPCVVSEEEYNSEIRTSIDLRDEEGRMIAGIASNGDGEARFLGMTLIGYLQAAEASVYLPEEKWEDLVGFAALLYGFEDKKVVYEDFIENFEEDSIITELQYTAELYSGYVKGYEWLESYGDISCQIEVRETKDGIRDIQSISFFNTPAYSTVSSEMACKNFMYYMFTSISGRYALYEEATGGKYDPVNRDEEFLESEYSAVYLNQYRDRVTENCLESMEWSGYFTLVDYLAAKGEAQIRFVDASLTEMEETKGDKNNKKYFYTATLSCEKDEEIKEFTVQGQIGVTNQMNGWKVYDFLLGDEQALSIHVTGENVKGTNYQLEVENKNPTITISEVTSDNYVITIEDEGYGPKMPVQMSVSFALDEEHLIEEDSEEVNYETGSDAKYNSVSVYLADEAENMKFAWITIRNVDIYSDSGEFLQRVEFEYELTFRFDTETLQLFDVKKNGENIVEL